MTNPLNYPITSPYGQPRTYTVNGVTYNDVHDGIDFAMPQGTPLTLPPGGGFDGKVTYAGLDQYGGAYVDIKANTDGGVARFLHLSRIDVHIGQQVTSNQQIGLSGGASNTWGAGLSTGSHLHFGLLVNNRAVDPLTWLQQAYSTPTPPPQPETPFLQHRVLAGDTQYKLAKQYGYPVTVEGTSQNDLRIYARLTEINPQTAGRLYPNELYNIDRNPVEWFNSTIQPQPEANINTAQPTMPSITTENHPDQALQNQLEQKEEEKAQAVKEVLDEVKLQVQPMFIETDLNELKKESFTFLKAFKGMETVGGVLATIILVAGFAIAKIDLLQGVLSPSQIAQATSILSLTLVVCKTAYSIVKQIFSK